MSKSAIIWWKVKKDKRRNGSSTQSAFFWMGWELPEGSQGRDRGDAPGPCGKVGQHHWYVVIRPLQRVKYCMRQFPSSLPEKPKACPPFLYKIHCMVFQKWSLGWMVAVGMVVR